jgi:hypothetical protein
MTTRLLTRVALLGALLLALSPLGPTTGAASASCAGPQLDLEPDQVLGPGDEVTGEWFLDGCQDSIGCTGGCSGGCAYDDARPRPSRDVVLRLRQDGRTWRLATGDASNDGEIVWTATLPPGVEPGRARLWASGTTRYDVRLAP